MKERSFSAPFTALYWLVLSTVYKYQFLTNNSSNANHPWEIWWQEAEYISQYLHDPPLDPVRNIFGGANHGQLGQPWQYTQQPLTSFVYTKSSDLHYLQMTNWTYYQSECLLKYQLQNKLRKLHTDTEKRAFPLIGNETSRSIIRNAHSRQYFSRPQMAMRWVAPRLTVGSYTAEKTKNTCGPSERSEFKKSCRTVKSWVESALKLIDILQDCKHKSCSC